MRLRHPRSIGDLNLRTSVNLGTPLLRVLYRDSESCQHFPSENASTIRLLGIAFFLVLFGKNPHAPRFFNTERLDLALTLSAIFVMALAPVSRAPTTSGSRS